ncbi:amidase family protein [Xenorhabdus stockiae]|uniref:amidase family protein n=1 Tax=Xenorhabdus stockiae TaxID=351614 RepID=UPI0040632607
MFAYPFNISGQPAISLPLGWSDEGIPIGIQLVGRYKNGLFYGSHILFSAYIFTSIPEDLFESTSVVSL